MIVAPFRVTRGQRQQAGPPVTSVPALSSHQVTAVTNKVNRLLTLSRVCSEELDFRTTGHLTATSKDQTHDGIRLSCRSNNIPARAPLGHPTPYLQERQSIKVPTK